MDLKTPFNKKLFFFIIFNLFVCTQVEANDTTKVVDYMDADYPRDSIYKANYKMALPKWYSLDDHLKLKPKYLILVEQPLELNNKGFYD